MANIPSTARARIVGIDVVAKNTRVGTQFLPQAILLIGQPNTGETPPSARALVTSANAVGTVYGFGSPLHQAAVGAFANQKGVPTYVAPLADGTTAATGSITATGTSSTAAGTVQITVSGIVGRVIAIPSGTAIADVPALIIAGMSGVINSPVGFTDATGGVTTLTSKWKGESANDIKFSISADVAGLTFAAVAMASGAGDVDPTTVLDAQLGEEWIPIVVNCQAATAPVLLAFSTKSEERWAADVRRAFIATTGFNGSALSGASAITSAITSDRTNAIIPSIDSELSIAQIAGAAAGIIANLADTNPARDYAGTQMVGGIAGADTSQPNSADREAAFQLGVGHTKNSGTTVFMADTITPYRLPEGETDPLFRYVVDIMKTWQLWYNLQETFTSQEWNGAPLVPDGQVTRPSVGAKTPSMVVAEIVRIINSLAFDAIVSDPAAIVATVTAAISSVNPKRIDAALISLLSGNTNIIAINLGVGFYFGGS